MKKIAIISSGHTGSLFPLIKRFLSQGHCVDLYLFSSALKTPEGFTIKERIIKNGEICELSSTEWEGLSDYLESSSFRFFCCGIYGLPFFHRLGAIIIKHHIKKLCFLINKMNYDYINLVGRYSIPYYTSLVDSLSGNVVVSLHEVCNHQNPDFATPNTFIEHLIYSKIPIVVHSTKSRDDILNYKNIDPQKIHYIPFGLFESYSSIKKTNFFDNTGKNYVLFVGGILPYKGLDVLYKAVTEQKEFFKGVKFVVAGKGYVPVLEKMEKDNSFICINRFLSNEEMVELISNCKFIVCPYQTMSQSGIPQTAFVFNKPIIASNLDGFKGVVNDYKEGLFFQKGDSQDLANKMSLLLNDNQLYSSLVDNIRYFVKNNKDYSWDFIANQYLELFSKL